jgi:hypothetical protein
MQKVIIEILKGLLKRFWPSGVLFILGFILILYIGLSILYFQQMIQQRELEKNIASINKVITKPLTSAEELKTEYEEVRRSLSPSPLPATLDILLNIAKDSGIDVNPNANKFIIPAPRPLREAVVGGGTYSVLSFEDIRVQGHHEAVMAFISDLDSGKTLETMVLKVVDIELGAETVASLNIDLYTKTIKED